MLGRVAEQYKADSGFAAILAAYGAQVQEIEDALYDIHVGYDLDNAVGDQLDILGKVVAQARDGATDAEYRPRIRARIRALLSSGSTEDLLAVLAALLGTEALGAFTHHYEGPQGQRLLVNSTLTADLAAVAGALIGRARAAGERTIFDWFESAEAGAFTLAGGTGLGLDDEGSPGSGGELAGSLLAT